MGNETKKIDDGGPAFPGGEDKDISTMFGVQSIQRDRGMSLRDWFAGMQNIEDFNFNYDSAVELAGEPSPTGSYILPSDNHEEDIVSYYRWYAKVIAAWRGIMADAMLAERAKP